VATTREERPPARREPVELAERMRARPTGVGCGAAWRALAQPAAEWLSTMDGEQQPELQPRLQLQFGPKLFLLLGQGAGGGAEGAAG